MSRRCTPAELQRLIHIRFLASPVFPKANCSFSAANPDAPTKNQLRCTHVSVFGNDRQLVGKPAPFGLDAVEMQDTDSRMVWPSANLPVRRQIGRCSLNMLTRFRHRRVVQHRVKKTASEDIVCGASGHACSGGTNPVCASAGLAVPMLRRLVFNV